MIANAKQLIVVLFVAVIAFALLKPMLLPFTAEHDYTRRRNTWLILTAVAFLSPSFWLFAAVAAPLLIWASRSDSNAPALYLLLMQLIPSVPLELPTLGIVKKLFELDMYRLLSLFVLIPAALRLRRVRAMSGVRGFGTMDALLLLYGLLQIVIYIRPDIQSSDYMQDSLTNAMRRGWLFFIDTYLLYWVVSRSCTSARSIADAMAAFTLSACIMAPLAVLETLRHWLLYGDFATRWGSHIPFTPYLFRMGLLRAQVSAGHPLALGYLFAIAFGFWLYLGSHIQTMRRIAVAALLWLGLLAAYSRGPWLGAVLILFTFAACSPGAARSLLKVVGVVAAAAVVVLLSPVGKSVISVLPFFGGLVDASNLTYREQLADRSWQLIQQHPWLGDPFAYANLQDLRQGQGIIDLVNTYAQVTMFYGFIGLALFVVFILIPLWKSYGLTRELAQSAPNMALLGASLCACVVGTLAMIYSTSFLFGYEKMYYVLAGLAAGYIAYANSLFESSVTRVMPPERTAASSYGALRTTAEPR